MPSHYLNQCCDIANWTLGTHFNDILIRVHTFLIQENPFQNFVWKMESILSLPQCVYLLNSGLYPSVTLSWMGIILVVQSAVWSKHSLFTTFLSIMTSSNGTIFRVTGPLWGESTDHWFLWLLPLICEWTNGWTNNFTVKQQINISGAEAVAPNPDTKAH